jgi:hypothetical protein
VIVANSGNGSNGVAGSSGTAGSSGIVIIRWATS